MDFSELKYQNFTKQYEESLITMALESYQSHNSFSIAGLQSKQELEFRIRTQITLFQQANDKFNTKHKTDRQLFKIVTHQGKIVAAIMACDLHYFYSDLITMLDPQDPYIQIYRYLDPNDLFQGTALFASLFVVRKEYMKKKVGYFLYCNMVQDYKRYNVKFVISSPTNPISLKFTLKSGGRIIHEQIVTRNGRKAKQYLLINDVDDAIRRMKPKL